MSKLLFLGTGGSMGVPVIGCHCPVCTSTDPHNKRLRPSALIEANGKKLLIDCGPDYRQQALRYGIEQLDGVVLTHAHNDHTAGIDELRVYYMHTHKSLPLLLSPETAQDLKARFSYIFTKERFYKLLPTFDLHVLPGDVGEIEFLGFPIRYYSYFQAGMKVQGFRFGNLAYVSDIHDYDESIFPFLEGVEILILSALRIQPSPLHFTVDEAAAFAKKVKAKMTWLSHLAHELDYQETNQRLPSNVQLAYDGLTIDFTF